MLITYNIPRHPECPQKISAQSVQPFGRLYATYIYLYECLVLLHRLMRGKMYFLNLANQDRDKLFYLWQFIFINDGDQAYKEADELNTLFDYCTRCPCIFIKYRIL